MAAIEICTNIPCVNSCLCCPQGVLKNAYNGPRGMDFETFCKIISTVPLTNEIHFSGFSEPFVCPEIARMILYAHAAGYKIIVYTTLLGVRLSDLESLLPVPFVHFGVHRPDGDLFVAKQDISSNILELASSITNFGIVKLSRNTITNRCNLVPDDIVRHRSRIGGKITCRYKDGFVVVPDGRVYMCCNDFGLTECVGNLLEIGFDELKTTDAYLSIQNRRISGEIICRYCTEAISVCD